MSRRRAESAGSPRAESDGQGLQAGAGQAGRRRDAHRGVHSQIQDCEYFTCRAGYLTRLLWREQPSFGNVSRGSCRPSLGYNGARDVSRNHEVPTTHQPYHHTDVDEKLEEQCPSWLSCNVSEPGYQLASLPRFHLCHSPCSTIPTHMATVVYSGQTHKLTYFEILTRA